MSADITGLEEETDMEEEKCEVVEVTESLMEDQLGTPWQSGVSDRMQNASLEVGSHYGGVNCI